MIGSSYQNILRNLGLRRQHIHTKTVFGQVCIHLKLWTREFWDSRVLEAGGPGGGSRELAPASWENLHGLSWERGKSKLFKSVPHMASNKLNGWMDGVDWPQQTPELYIALVYWVSVVSGQGPQPDPSLT